MRTPGPLVGEKAVEEAKELFGGTVSSEPPPQEFDEPKTLIEKYPPGDSRLVWEGKPEDARAALIEHGISDAETNFPVTDEYESAERSAFEFEGRYLLVEYHGWNMAAIWEGAE